MNLVPNRTALPSMCLLAVLACNEPGTGDDLPPGAFTSGPADTGSDPDPDPDVGEASSSSSASTDEASGTTAAPADTGSDDGPVVLSYQSDIQPIWDASCLDPSCHDSEAPAGSLDLQSDGVYDRLCTNNSAAITSIALVDCEGHAPDQSWVYRKLTGDIDLPGAGSLMPAGAMLTPDELATIEAWIIGGTLP